MQSIGNISSRDPLNHSYQACQKEEKEYIWVKYFIYTVLSQFQICRNLHVVFLPNLTSQNFRVHTNMVFPSLAITPNIYCGWAYRLAWPAASHTAY